MHAVYNEYDEGEKFSLCFEYTFTAISCNEINVKEDKMRKSLENFNNALSNFPIRIGEKSSSLCTHFHSFPYVRRTHKYVHKSVL
jgi:hypothetical protein